MADIPSSSTYNTGDIPGPIPAAAGGEEAVLIDWTGATESNTGGKGGNTDINGTSIRVEIAAVQQLLTTLNCYTIAKEIEGKPVAASGLRLFAKIGNPDQAPAIGANAGIHFAIATQDTPATNKGVICGIELQDSPGPRYRAQAECKKLGTNPAGVTIIDVADVSVAALVVELRVRFDPTTGNILHAASIVYGADGVNAHHLDVTGVTGTTFYAMILCEQDNATPGDVLDMDGIQVWRLWETDPS